MNDQPAGKSIFRDPRFWLVTAVIWFLSPSWAILFQEQPDLPFPLISPVKDSLRIWAAPYVICELISLWIWPFNRDPVLRPLEPERLLNFGLIYWLILILLLRHTWRLRKQNPAIFLGLFITLLTLFPLIAFLPENWPPFSQHYLLFSGFGLSMLMAGLLYQTARLRHLPSRQWAWKILFGVCQVLIILWVFARPWETAQRLRHSWEERVRQTIELDRSNFAAATELGRIEGLKGNHHLAEEWLLAAESRAPWYQGIPIAKAEVLIAQGNNETARLYLTGFLQQHPNHPTALRLLEKLDSSQP